MVVFALLVSYIVSILFCAFPFLLTYKFKSVADKFGVEDNYDFLIGTGICLLPGFNVIAALLGWKLLLQVISDNVVLPYSKRESTFKNASWNRK